MFRFPHRRSRRVRTGIRGQVAAEVLEQRTMLTTFVVDTPNDWARDADGTPDGKISLREAIIAANTNQAFGDAPAGEAGLDTIVFDTTVFPAGVFSTINARQDSFVITEDLTIDGDNRVRLETPFGQSRRLIRINHDGATTLKGLFLNGGQANGDGGAVFATGGRGATLTLDDVIVSRSQATNGGGVAVRGFTDLNVSDSLFTSNFASQAGGAIFHQGAGNVTISSSTIGVENAGHAFSEFDKNRALYGGGIAKLGGRQLTLTDTAVGNNEALVAGAGLFADRKLSSELTVAVNGNSRFMNNALNARSSEIPAGELAGGTHMAVRNATTMINDAIFRDALGPDADAARFGNTIQIQGGSADIRDSRFEDNVGDADTTGGVFVLGASLTLTNGEFTRETAARGSAVMFLPTASDHRLQVDETLFKDNTGRGVVSALSPSTVLPGLMTDTPQQGIATFFDVDFEGNDDAVELHSLETVRFDDSEFRGNGRADGPGTAATITSVGMTTFLLTNFYDNVSQSAAALNITPGGGTVEIDRSNFMGNRNETAGFGSSQGGALAIDVTSGGSVVIGRSNFRSNTAAFGGAVAILDAAGSSHADVTITGSEFTGNSAAPVPAPMSDETASSQGGAVYLKNSNAAITESTFENNTAATGVGGAIAVVSDVSGTTAKVTLTASPMRQNAAAQGGGLYVSGQQVELTDTVFIGNTAFGSADLASVGGGLFAHASVATSVTINGGQFRGNRALYGAGAALTGASTPGDTALGQFDITGTKFIRNLSRNFTSNMADLPGDPVAGGGALFVQNQAAQLTDVVIEENRVLDGVGGGVSAVGAMFSMTNGLIRGNRAHSGGGINAVTSTVALTGTTIGGTELDDANRATGAFATGTGTGGGVRLAGSVLNADLSMIVGNVASFQGGGVYAFDSSADLVDSEVRRNLTLGFTTSGAGGAGIYAINSPLDLERVRVERNSASGSQARGGGLFARGSGIAIRIDESHFVGNVSGGSGGGIEVDSAQLQLTDSVIGGLAPEDGNKATRRDGGGIRVTQSTAGTAPAATATINGTTIQNNEAAWGGGGISSSGRMVLDVDSSLILNNLARGLAGGSGGGVSMGDGTIRTTTIANNRVETPLDQATAGFGGGVAVFGTVTMDGVTIRDNAAVSNGGGVFVSTSASLTLDNSIVRSNTADDDDDMVGDGGGVFVATTPGGSSGQLFQNNSVINDNTPNDVAGI